MHSQEGGQPQGELGHIESRLALLAAIQERLTDLAGFASDIIYQKSPALESAAETAGFKKIDLYVSGDGTGGDRAVEVATSYKDSLGRRPRIRAILEESDGTWRATFGGAITHEALLQLTPEDAPPVIGDILSVAHTTCLGGKAWTELAGDAANQAADLWQAAEDYATVTGVPTSYDYRYDTQVNGRDVSIEALGMLPKPDGTSIPEEWIDHTNVIVKVDEVFTCWRSTYRGIVVEGFEDAADIVPDSQLPPLTDDERQQHPFEVVPSDPDQAEPTFKVVTRLIGTRLAGRYIELEVPTAERAQELADLSYRRVLADARVPREVTPERLKRVRAILDTVLAKASAEVDSSLADAEAS